MAWILHLFLPDLCCTQEGSELRVPCHRLDQVMKNESGMFGLIVGCVVALVAFAFIFSGGELGGKKVIEGDRDLPPVETTNN
jgi:hypothetical protein